MASDFYSVETVRLRRLHVLFFIHHVTRLVRIADVTAKPTAELGDPACPEPLHGTRRAGSSSQVPHS
jgi:hypothetical protein